jgi:hypothetical protein
MGRESVGCEQMSAFEGGVSAMNLSQGVAARICSVEGESDLECNSTYLKC